MGQPAKRKLGAVRGSARAAAAAVTDGMTVRWVFGSTVPTSPASGSPRVTRRRPDKVFIASVWEGLELDPEFGPLGANGFKAQLVEAHRRGLLRSSRADLVAAMAPADVAASETRHQNATYHFIERGGTG
jgi:hypothetical protein